MSVTIEMVIEQVRNLAKQNPENRYGRESLRPCFYERGLCTNGSIGCIFGQALKNLGLSNLDKQVEYNDDTGILNLLNKLNIKTTDSQQDWCRNVQSKQDTGLAWGKAVECADAITHAVWGEKYGPGFY